MRKELALGMVAALALLVGRAAAGEQKAAAEEHVRGDVMAVKGGALTVKTNAGQTVKVELPTDVPVAQVEKADVDAIQSGAFVGVAAVPERNGKLRAVEVHVFPESMRGTGEGARPWDLRPGSSITNATVASKSGSSRSASTMTNGTVSDVAGSSTSRTLELKYGGEGRKVVVPPGTPVVKLKPAERTALKPGAPVFAIAKKQPDGALLAQRIMVGEGMVRPPM